MKRSVFLLSATMCGGMAWAQATSSSPQASPAAGQTTPSSQAKPSTATSGASAAPDQLRARGPEAVAQQSPDKVVASIGGKDITAKQALDFLKPLRPEDRKRFESNLPQLVQQVYMETQLASQATGMKLDQQSPWKEQLEISRDNILTQAYLAKMSESGTSATTSRAYYDAHVADYDQMKLSGILVAFNPPGTPASSTTVQRTEAQAQEKANDLEKKLKAGGDFSALARTDSDNQQSATRGGELGTFVLADQQLPPEVKATVSKLQSGDVSEPVRVQGGFYIFKVDSRTKLPFEQVQAGIAQKLQSEKMQAVLKQESEKYQIQVKDSDFFGGANAAASPAMRVPSLQRPASNVSPAPAAPPK